jgi:PHD/YefM family antitoxin component YafN of YafNO toxin-antitoxin module
MATIMPISELTNNPYRISKLCHSQDEPVFITKDGYGDMVVMSFDQYEQLKTQAQANISRSKLDFSKPVTISEDSIDENADTKAQIDGIKKLPLEDVIDILKSELEKQKPPERAKRERFP